eukprot:1768798-Amphidinium_carterae.1
MAGGNQNHGAMLRHQTAFGDAIRLSSTMPPSQLQLHRQLSVRLQSYGYIYDNVATYVFPKPWAPSLAASLAREANPGSVKLH